LTSFLDDIAGIGQNTQLALAGCTLFGGVAGAVGTFVLARRRALLADVAGHASLPGVWARCLRGCRVLITRV
jgi:manganese/zinc/iron transport system permease protein